MLAWRALLVRAVVTTVLLLAMPAAAKELSRLEKVGLLRTDDAILVHLTGTRAPVFTSFTLHEPFRVVIDWSGSRLGKVSTSHAFEEHVVERVELSQFGSESEQITRTVIRLARDMTYRVFADGTTVTVRFDAPPPSAGSERAAVEKGAARPAVSRRTVAEDRPEDVLAALSMAEGPLTEPNVPIPDVPPPVAPGRSAAPRPNSARGAPHGPGMTAFAPVRSVPSTAPRPRSATLAVPAAAGPRAVGRASPGGRAPGSVTPPNLRAKRRAREGPPSPLIATAGKRRGSSSPSTATAGKRPGPRGLVSASDASSAAPAAFPAPTAAARETDRAVGSLPVSVRANPAAPPRSEDPRSEDPVRLATFTPSRPAVSGPPASPQTSRPSSRKSTFAQAAVALVEPDAVSLDEEEPTEAGPQDFDPGPRRMNYIGFRQMADVSRIFVRVDGRARYRALRRGATVVLELVDTTVPIRNNTRPLDTSYFNSPVMKVQALPSGANTRIVVRLRESVPFRVQRIGTTIALDFSRAG